MILIHYENLDFRCRVAPPSENDRENAEENDRKDKAQRGRAAVPAQGNNSRANDSGNQSRNSLPVKCRKTDSRFGLRMETSISSSPAVAEASSRTPTSAGRSMVNLGAQFLDHVENVAARLRIHAHVHQNQLRLVN